MLLLHAQADRAVDVIAEAEHELERRAGFQPLMHLFPSTEEARASGWNIAWSAADEMLREWARTEDAESLSPYSRDLQVSESSLVPHVPSHLHRSTSVTSQ